MRMRTRARLRERYARVYCCRIKEKPYRAADWLYRAAVSSADTAAIGCIELLSRRPIQLRSAVSSLPDSNSRRMRADASPALRAWRPWGRPPPMATDRNLRFLQAALSIISRDDRYRGERPRGRSRAPRLAGGTTLAAVRYHKRGCAVCCAEPALFWRVPAAPPPSPRSLDRAVAARSPLFTALYRTAAAACSIMHARSRLDTALLLCHRHSINLSLSNQNRTISFNGCACDTAVLQ
jgi:hypothetical protein